MNRLKKVIYGIISLIYITNVFSSNLENETLNLPKKSWASLLSELGPHALSPKALNLADCPEKITSEKQTGSVYQHIMFNDYFWEVYQLDNGLSCIKLTEPEEILLSAQEASVLLSASQGHGFEEAGFSQQVKQYAEKLDQDIPDCDESDATSVVEESDSKNNITLDLESDWQKGNYVPYTEEEKLSIQNHSIGNTTRTRNIKYKNPKFNHSWNTGCKKKIH